MFIYVVTEVGHEHKKVIDMAANGYINGVYRILPAKIACDVTNTIANTHCPLQLSAIDNR